MTIATAIVGADDATGTSFLRSFAERLTPDDVKSWPVEVVRFDSVHLACFGAPSGTTRVTSDGIRLGYTWGADAMSGDPAHIDGTFLLLRLHSGGLEVQTDATASFSVWWANTPIGTVVSTSQRLVIAALRSFSLDSQALSWFMVAGHLGLASSWDSRLQWVPPRSLVRFDADGRLLSHDRVRRRRPVSSLSSALEESIEAHRSVSDRCVLTLSGGVDSLALASALGDTASRLEALTWGTVAEAGRRGTDVEVAAAHARALRIPHHLVTQTSIDPVEALRRFARHAESRIDHVTGYLDGFQTWTAARALGREWVLRGDEGFGWLPVSSEVDMRVGTRFPTYSDVGLGPESRLGLEEQHTLARWFADDVTLETRRDEAYRNLNLPKVMAALSSAKSAFVETINPFLTRQVLDAAAALSDERRTDKREFRQLVHARHWVERSASRFVPNEPPEDLLRALGSERPWRHLPSSLIAGLPKTRMGKTSGTSSFNREIKAALPRSVRAWLRNRRPTRPVPTWRLWLRAWLAEEAIELFRADAMTMQ